MFVPSLSWQNIRYINGSKMPFSRTPRAGAQVVIRVFPGPFTTLRNTLKPPLRGAVLQTFGAVSEGGQKEGRRVAAVIVSVFLLVASCLAVEEL
jgi:hypothetical protein